MTEIIHPNQRDYDLAVSIYDCGTVTFAGLVHALATQRVKHEAEIAELLEAAIKLGPDIRASFEEQDYKRGATFALSWLKEYILLWQRERAAATREPTPLSGIARCADE